MLCDFLAPVASKINVVLLWILLLEYLNLAVAKIEKLRCFTTETTI